jgi:hypothetical protein
VTHRIGTHKSVALVNRATPVRVLRIWSFFEAAKARPPVQSDRFSPTWPEKRDP